MEATVNEQSRTSAVWGQKWLDALMLDPRYGESLLAIGERVARAHAEPDLSVVPGIAQVAVTAGPRRRYDVTITVPLLEDTTWAKLFDHVAASPSRSAALAAGQLDATLADDLRVLGVALLPAPGEVTSACDCDGWSYPCKHVVGALVSMADAIDEDPLLLLTLRGRPLAEVRSELALRRSDSLASIGVDESAATAWLRHAQPLPPPMPTLSESATTPSWGDPPPSAPFNADGLRLVGTDLIRRAAAMLDRGEPSGLHLDPVSDLARLAHVVDRPEDRRRIAEHSGVSARELAGRAIAWDTAGAIGVRAHVSPLETRRVGPDAQVRRVDHDGKTQWLRFEKRSGRWTLAAGPVSDPNGLLPTTEIGSTSTDPG